MNTGCRWLAITLFLFLCQSTGPASSFHEVRGSHFTVRWSGAPYTEHDARNTLCEAESAWNRCALFFGIRPSGRILVNLTDRGLMGIGSADTAPWARLITFRRCHLSFLGLRADYIVCHEVAHIFTSDWLGHGDSRKQGDMGPWGEGLADYVAGGFNGGPLQSWWAWAFKPYAGLDHLAGFETFPSIAPLQYVPITLCQWRAHSYILTSLLIQHLVKSRGRETVLRFYQALDSTWWQGVKDLPTALKTAIHQTLLHPCEPLKLPEPTVSATVLQSINGTYQRFYGKTEKEVLDEWESVSEKQPIPSDESRRLIARFDQYVSTLEMERRQPVMSGSRSLKKASGVKISDRTIYPFIFHQLPLAIIKPLEQARRALDAGDLKGHEVAMKIARAEADRRLRPGKSDEEVWEEQQAFRRRPKTFEWRNLILNGDFESGLGEWQGDGVLDDCGDARSKCLRLNPSLPREARASARITVEPDIWYLIAACMKGQGVRDQQVVVSWRSGKGEDVSTSVTLPMPENGEQWQRVERVVHAPKTAMTLSVTLVSGTPTGRTEAKAWFDDILAARVNPAISATRSTVRFVMALQDKSSKIRSLRRVTLEGPTVRFRPNMKCWLWLWLQPEGRNERLWIYHSMIPPGVCDISPHCFSGGDVVGDGVYWMHALLLPLDGHGIPWFATERIRVSEEPYTAPERVLRNRRLTHR